MNNALTQESIETMDFDTLEMLTQANATHAMPTGVSAESFAWEARQQQWGVNPVYEVLQAKDE